MDQDGTELTLPLRLEPRRGQVLLQLLFMLCWTGFIVYWGTLFVPEYLDQHGSLSPDEITAEHLFLLIPVGMLLVGFYSLGRLLLQLLPGNDFVYVLVGRDGLKRRQFGTRQEIRWGDIRRISIIRRRSGKSSKRVLLVEGMNDKPVRDDESARYTAATFTLDLGTYLPAFCNDDQANKVSAWLNGLLHQARAGVMPDRVPVPSLLMPSVKAAKAVGRARQAAEKPVRRNSIVER